MKAQPALIATLLLSCSSAALAQWSSNPGKNLPIADFAHEQYRPQIVANGDGSTWISWYDRRTGAYAIHAQRLDAQGVETFAHGGLIVSNHPQATGLGDFAMISDGAGGCVIAFTDIRAGGEPDPYAYRIDAGGQKLWGPNGVTLSNDSVWDSDPRITRTSDGKFVFVWANVPYPGPGSIRIQMLDGNGNPQYAVGGMQVVGQNLDRPQYPNVVASDAGSYIVSWVRDVTFMNTPWRLDSQKFDPAGNALWTGGAPVIVFDGPSILTFNPALLVSDDAGGAFYCWQRQQLAIGYDVLLQHVDNAGVELFGHDGISVCSDPTTWQQAPSMAFLPASGDVFVAFQKSGPSQLTYAISVQCISAAGALLFGNTGLDLAPMDTAYKWSVQCLPLGSQALVFSFNKSLTAPETYDGVGYRIDRQGASIWTPVPLPVATGPSIKGQLRAAIDTSGVARLVWGDSGNDAFDICAQNVNPDGSLGNSSNCDTTTYCALSPNSVGPGAVIGSSGSTSVELNNLVLQCSGLPTPSTGLFLYGPGTASTPLGNGTLCVSAPVYRIKPGAASINGFASRALDLNVPPASGGAGMITPGSTWFFDFFYRDNQAGGAQCNLSNGLQVNFCP